MAVLLSPYGGVGAQFLDNSGNVLTGGKIFTYAAGTTTPQVTYTNSTGTTPHSNPIILDASGRVATGEIWLTDGFQYKFVLKDSNDVLIATYDNIIGINSNFVNFSNEQEIQTATAGQTVFNLAAIEYQPGTNSLSVFVDGVNQYGPGAQYAYVETDSDTVTFTNGLHVGAQVKFTTSQINSSAGGNASQVTYDPPYVNSVATTVENKLSQLISVKDFGAVGDGVTDDTAAWNAFQAAVGLKMVPPGQYLVNSNILRFDAGLLGNGEFFDADSAWDQPQGDRERDSLIVHHRDINVNAQLVSPTIKTQTFTNWQQDTPVPGFKHVLGSYHEVTMDGYYDIQTDTDQNFTVAGSAVLNRMAGLMGSLAHLAYCEDTTDVVNPDISTMGATKNGCSLMRFTRKAKYAQGGYMFGLEVYALNSANETTDVPYQNNDEYAFTAFTTGHKITAGSSGAPLSSALFTSGLNTKHGFWNGLVVGSTSFKINNDGNGVAGTVGINLASWRSTSGYADIGIKYRTANWHHYYREGCRQRASLTRFAWDAGACGIHIESSGTNGAYLSFRNTFTDPNVTATEIGRITSTTSAIEIEGVGANVQLSTNSGGNAIYVANGAYFAPAVANDNQKTLGASNRRWSEVYAGNGTINTSDARLKQDVSSIDDSVLDAWGNVNFVVFRWIESVKEKGESARTHSGVIAQQVKEALEAQGLDPYKFSVLCYDKWDAQPEQIEEIKVEVKPPEYEQILVNPASTRIERNENGEEVELEIPAEYRDGEITKPAVYETRKRITPAIDAGDRWSIRYEEALVIEAAYQRRRADRIEARLAAIEAALGS